eukprot:m.23997 g.23997  ORF g.23997 m.23997 type:complete len:275 (+) comp28558_c0_seq6:1286-2110(+)
MRQLSPCHTLQLIMKTTDLFSLQTTGKTKTKNYYVLITYYSLDDFCHAVKSGDTDIMCVVAGILLDLSMSPISRRMMTENVGLPKALAHLIDTGHHETQRLALQTIELLALEDLQGIISEKSLLRSLLAVPETSSDIKLWTLAGKVLMYFADSSEGCDALIHADHLIGSLTRFISSGDVILQAAVSKVVLSMSLYEEHRLFLLDLGFQDLLVAFRGQAVDQDVVADLDQGLVHVTGSKQWAFARHGSSRSLSSGPATSSTTLSHTHRVKFATPD